MAEQEAESAPLTATVLIVAYNCQNALHGCVAALENSTGRDSFEILVVDNGSQDGSADIDSEFPNVTVLRLPRHFGLTKARNIGARTAKGPNLFLLTPDVRVEPDAVTTLVRHLEEESSALAVCPLLVDQNGAPVSRAYRLPPPEAVKSQWQNPYSVRGEAIDPAAGPQPVELHDGKALMVRKQAIQGINYLDEKYGESWIDVELAWQIRRAGRKILLVPDARARLDPEVALWRPADAAERAAVDADAACGAARYLSKHSGGTAALLFQIGLTLATLFQLFTFNDLSYRFALLSRIASGAKIDGTDQSL